MAKQTKSYPIRNIIPQVRVWSPSLNVMRLEFPASFFTILANKIISFQNGISKLNIFFFVEMLIPYCREATLPVWMFIANKMGIAGRYIPCFFNPYTNSFFMFIRKYPPFICFRNTYYSFFTRLFCHQLRLSICFFCYNRQFFADFRSFCNVVVNISPSGLTRIRAKYFSPTLVDFFTLEACIYE